MVILTIGIVVSGTAYSKKRYENQITQRKLRYANNQTQLAELLSALYSNSEKTALANNLTLKQIEDVDRYLSKMANDAEKKQGLNELGKVKTMFDGQQAVTHLMKKGSVIDEISTELLATTAKKLEAIQLISIPLYQKLKPAYDEAQKQFNDIDLAQVGITDFYSNQATETFKIELTRAQIEEVKMRIVAIKNQRAKIDLMEFVTKAEEFKTLQEQKVAEQQAETARLAAEELERQRQAEAIETINNQLLNTNNTTNPTAASDSDNEVGNIGETSQDIENPQKEQTSGIEGESELKPDRSDEENNKNSQIDEENLVAD